MTTLCARHPSALGELLLVGERDPGGDLRLTGLYLPDDRRRPAVDPAATEDRHAFVGIAAQLDAYLAGERTAFEMPLALRGTPFQRRVWTEIERIPFGETVTYAELARRVGRPGVARAVGSAVARNPVSVVVPCHRVVGTGGGLTGYAGGLDRKARLLDLERRVAARTGREAGAVGHPVRHLARARAGRRPLLTSGPGRTATEP